MSFAERESLARFQRARRFALFVLVSIGIVVLLSCRSRWTDPSIHEFVEAFGLGLMGIAIAGRMWCTLYIGGRKASEIVDLGPYSITRNPLYLFSSLAAAGAGAQTGSIVIACLFGVVTALAFHLVILREERFLRETFGKPYEDYLRRVPRFFPRAGGWRDADVLNVRPARLYRTLGDGLVFFLAVPGFEAIEALQQAGYLPVVLRLP